MTLNNAHARGAYVITKISGTESIGRRLLDMGFTPNTRIYVAAIAPFKGTVLAIIRNCMIALRSDAATCVNVAHILP